MKQGPLPSVDSSGDMAGHADLPRCGPLPTRVGVTGPGPEEPLGVVAVGPAGAERRGVLATLLGLDPVMLTVPSGSWLVVRHAKAPTRAAYVPGYRQPHSYGADRDAAGPALARPPRRVELSVPEPLLRHFTLVDTPDTGTLGVAGGRVLLDAVGRAGALLFVIAADQAFTAAELNLLAEVAAAPVNVVFAVTPGAAGWAPLADGVATTEGTGASVPPPGGVREEVDPVAVTVEAHRAALLAAVPSLAGARWFPVDDAESAADLRRALVGWAAQEGLQRASADPPVLPGQHDRVTVVADPGDWSEQLDRQTRSCSQRIRQHLALELANAHLRVVQEIVFGVGCAGLPELLDREMAALSLLATAQCDQAVRGILANAAARVLGAPPAEGVLRRIATAVQYGLTDHRPGRDLDRVLLITSTAGVAGLTGPEAIDALDGYPRASRDEVLPPVAVALSGGCWQQWRTPGNDDQNAARAWSQRALREVELGLSREVSRRFEVIRLSLGAVLSDAVDHGILLA
ncbi:hypothetical protein DKT68_14620 [Micromonospora acroterricola]|uniref:Dynamin family protein n=1 Tax=Micromonospora acroterricola TaxID=2202421 RepID=A0A317D2A7_9ACTN|nr:hypothetical protein [Micromonospora acroterricola]PWR08634.1 hypothetical protein DKT68_14620 [Micromonospora acroterricola]